MRTIKELLIIVRDNMETENFVYGMCALIYRLLGYKTIDADEFLLLNKYFDNNVPITFNTVHNRIINCNFSRSFIPMTFWWGKSDKKPRIKWLNRQINKL
jgi:hypothetical protein